MGHYKSDCRSARSLRLWSNNELYRKIFEQVAFSEPSCDDEDIGRVMSARCVTDDNYMGIVVTGAWSDKAVHTNNLADSGSSFSGISRELAQKYKIPIIPPAAGEIQWLHGATEEMKSKRLGHVVLPVTLHFPTPTGSATVSLTKKFEVMDMDLDFLFGREVNRVIFPNDIINGLGGPHSSITDEPHDVDYRTAPARSRRLDQDEDRTGASGEVFDVHGDDVAART